VTEALQSAGLSDIWAQEEKHPIRVANVGAFLAMAEASPLIHAELAVLAPEVRSQLMGEVQKALRTFETANGFEWTYPVLAVVARK
jgi:hypothetical protein